MEILSGADKPKDIVSKEYVDGQIKDHVHNADDIPCSTKILKLGDTEYKISENLQKALENLLDYIYMNASGVLDLQTNLKSVSDTVKKIPAYKGGTGISVAGDTIGHSNNTLPGMVGTGEILTPDFGDTVYTTWFSYDAQGHVTQSGTGGFKIPTAETELDTKSANPIANSKATSEINRLDSRINSKADMTYAVSLAGKIDAKADATELAKVATSGSYNDLSDKPTIPKAVTVDAELNNTSTNPLQNKAVKAKFDAVDSQISSLSTDNGNLWAKVKTKADNTAEGATALLGNLSESNTAPGDEDEVIIKNLNQYTHRPLTKLFDWIKANLAKVATSGSYNDLKDKPEVTANVTSGDGSLITSGGVYSKLYNYRPMVGLTGTNGSYGYTCFAQLKIKHNFVNKPIEFKLSCRGRGVCNLSIRFVNTSSTDPSIEILECMGAEYEIYAYKSTTSTWQLYYKKFEKYDEVTIVSAYNPYATSPEYLEITYPGTFAATKHTGTTTNPVVDSKWGYIVGTAINANTWDGHTTAQTVLFTAESDVKSATIDGLFTKYTLIWAQFVGSKTTHTHIIPLAYLKSKGSLVFKDSGVAFNIIKDSDTSIRWFEYQGQGTETYTSVTIVKII